MKLIFIKTLKNFIYKYTAESENVQAWVSFLFATWQQKKIQCDSCNAMVFCEKNAPKSPSFKDFLFYFLKLLCVDNSF